MTNSDQEICLASNNEPRTVFLTKIFANFRSHLLKDVSPWLMSMLLVLARRLLDTTCWHLQILKESLDLQVNSFDAIKMHVLLSDIKKLWLVLGENYLNSCFTGGNIFHGAMSLDSMFLMRPVKGWYVLLFLQVLL